MLSEREILASLVAAKRYSTAEMIHRENEKKKTKAKAPAVTKNDKKCQTSNTHNSVN